MARLFTLLVVFVVALTSGASAALLAPGGGATSQPAQRAYLASARTSATYPDGTGDTQTAGGPDLSSAVVTDTDGYISISVKYANRSCLDAGELLSIEIDGDQSSSSGVGFGAEYKVYFWPPTHTAEAQRWNGSRWVDGTSLIGLECKGDHDLIFFDRNEFRITSGFNFFIRVSGSGGLSDTQPAPVNYQLTMAASPTQPEPQSFSRTWKDAPGLHSRIRFDGASIKHVRLGERLYETMKHLGSPRVVAVACWSESDWPGVLESATGPANEDGSVTVAFWLPRQPRWLHISPSQCANVQRLMTDRRVTPSRAYALGTVLHERVHAEGVRNEAQTNCYGVQLVYSFARSLGFPYSKAVTLERLAVQRSRAVAPRDYWNAAQCRDGGKWDLLSNVQNLGV